mgnify:CR=1 FL=1
MKKRTILQEFRFHQSAMKENAKEKARESMSAVLPIVLIVLALGFTIAALSPSILVEFLIGAVLVVAGRLFFSMGAELSMTPMGEHVGGSMLRTRKLGFIMILGFILGPLIEKYMRMALISANGNWGDIMARPVAVFFVIIAVLFVVVPMIRKATKATKKAQ